MTYRVYSGPPGTDTVPPMEKERWLYKEFGLLDFPFRVGSVWVLYPGALRKRLKKEGPVPRERMEHIAKRLDLSFPKA